MKLAIINSEITQHNSNIEDMFNRFTQFVDVSQATVKTYTYGVRAFLKYLAINGINTPTRDTVLSYKKELSKKNTASTIALYLSSLRRFFAWCASENLYSDITLGVKSPRIDTGHKKDAFSVKQIQGILSKMSRDSLKGKRDYAIFTLAVATGLRTCEITRANIGDIRNVNGEDCLFVQGKGKSSKSDFVKLSGHVLQVIQAYLEARGVTGDNEPLFASVSHRNSGGRMTTRSISRICKQAMKKTGHDSKRLTAHSLRHTAITIALLQGLPIQEVSQFARHSNISVTMIYSHDIERLKSKCENAISNAIFG